MVLSALIQAWNNIRDNTAAALSGVITTSVSLVILGSFVLVYLNLITLTHVMFQQSRYSVFIDSETDRNVRRNIIAQLKSIEGVYEVTTVGSIQAKAELIDSFGESGAVLRKIELPPFPDVIEFSLNRSSILTRSEIETIQEIDGVDEVVSGIETKDQIKIFFTIAEFVGLFLIALLLVSLVLIIHSAIQIAVRTRIDEIEIFKILGATPTYIRIPFVIEGVLIALTGYLISLAVIYLLFTFVVAGVTFNEATYGIKEIAGFYTPLQMFLILLMIVILGIVSSVLATNKVFQELKA